MSKTKKLRGNIGRPADGITKKLSLTLPHDYWDKLDDYESAVGASSRSELLRNLIISFLDKEIKIK